jgi:hypothetical protein
MEMKEMKASTGWIGVLAVALGGSPAWAQGRAVQLPSYSYFTTNGTVVVPDNGAAYLGGVNRARSGTNEFGAPLGPLGNRSIGSERSVSGTSVSVHVHDFEAMDEMILGPDFRSKSRAAAGSGDPRRTTGDPRRALGDPRRALGDPGRAPPSVAEIVAQRRRDQEARQVEAEGFFERGQSAEEAGKANVARIYYQMAAKRATGPLKEQIAARLSALAQTHAPLAR